MLVIGVGNAYRRDDGAGVAVAEALAARGLTGVEVVAHHGEGAELMALWKGRGHVVVVDAVSSGAAPGSIHRFVAQDQELPANMFCFSSHAFGLAQAVSMARVLGQLPARLIILGIEGIDFGPGEGLTPAVAAAVAAVVDELAGA